MTIDEQLNAIEGLNAECRAAALSGNTKRAWALWDEATEQMKAVLGMEMREARYAKLRAEIAENSGFTDADWELHYLVAEAMEDEDE